MYNVNQNEKNHIYLILKKYMFPLRKKNDLFQLFFMRLKDQSGTSYRNVRIIRIYFLQEFPMSLILMILIIINYYDDNCRIADKTFVFIKS